MLRVQEGFFRFLLYFIYREKIALSTSSEIMLAGGVHSDLILQLTTVMSLSLTPFLVQKRIFKIENKITFFLLKVWFD
jgi:hypothetical protein